MNTNSPEPQCFCVISWHKSSFVSFRQACHDSEKLICYNRYPSYNQWRLTDGTITRLSGKANSIKEDKKLQTTIAKPPSPPLSAQVNAVKTNINTIISNDLKLSMSTNKWTYAIGDKFEIFFSVTKPLYVEIIDITPDGQINRIFQNDSQRDNYCLPGKTYKIPPEKGDFELRVTPPTGVDRIKAIASPAAMDVAAAAKTRGIQFTKTLVYTTQTRANLSIVIQ